MKISDQELIELIEWAEKTYFDNFDGTCWFGRCIFISWYCDVGTCKFCFRSTTKTKIRHAQTARRTMDSLIVEALLCKNLGWRIEFLTGGYKVYPINELLEIAKNISTVFGEKIWLNLGVISDDDLIRFKPYVKGIVSSIECIEPKLHDEICPDKQIENYENMFEESAIKDYKKSITIVIGLGEKKSDFNLLKKFIHKHNLDRITFYALKPIKGTGFEKGPDSEYYAWWIAKTRIEFPKLQIIAGSFANRVSEIELLLRAGANGITKFPATKKFNSPEAKEFERQVKLSGRKFVSNMTSLPDVNWHAQIDEFPFSDELKAKIKKRLDSYLDMMRNYKDNDVDEE